MENQYAKCMKDFFKEVDPLKKSSPIELAKAFANHFVAGGRRASVKLPTDHLYNVSILAQDTALSFFTKRVPLVADTTVLTHYRQEQHLFYSFTDSPAAWGADKINTTCYLRCPSLEELGNWLIACELLLLQGDIFYFPDILMSQYTENRYDDTGNTTDSEESIGPLCDLIVTNRKISDVLTHKIAKSQLVRLVLQIDLPYIENCDLKTFSKITSDERAPLERFRDFLRLKFLDLQENEGSEFFEANLAKIGTELRDGIRGLSSDYEALKRKTAFQVTGATIAATTATLVAVNSTAFGVLSQVLGTSGGLLAIVNALERHISEKHRIEDMPYYYLWLFYREASNR